MVKDDILEGSLDHIWQVWPQAFLKINNNEIKLN